MKLSKFLCEQGFALSRAEARRVISCGVVKINGVSSREDLTLNLGDIVGVKGKKAQYPVGDNAGCDSDKT
jgi:RNA-binding protein YlmH